jgi:hypothetical protein
MIYKKFSGLLKNVSNNWKAYLLINILIQKFDSENRGKWSDINDQRDKCDLLDIFIFELGKSFIQP